MADLTATLLGCQNPDPNIRSAAEAALRTAEEQNLPQFMMALAQELAGEGKDANGRQLAGLHFKNLLSAKDSSMREAKTSKWKALDGQVRGPIKAVLIGALHSQEKQARHTAAQACAEVASIELPHGEWAEYLPTIMANVTENSQEAIKIATLECLGFTCELLAFEGNELNEGDTNQMLTAIVNGTTKEQTDEVRLAATVALRNSISFTKKNFEVPAERTMIMQTVCETTQCSNENVRAAAYEVLSSIVYSFYEKLQEYMQAIFEISFNSIKSDCQLVALQAIEFWCVLCETEMEVLDEIMSAKEAGYPSEQTCNRYVAAAMEHLVPLLTNHLSQQDEHAEIDDDIWNMSMASATLLVLVAQTVEDAVVPLVMPYVSQNIQSPEWRFREAAIMAFASILDGPNSSSIESYVRESVSVLLKSLQDPHQMVKSAAAYCIGKICDLHVRAVPQDAFPPLVQNLMAVLPKETPAVASQACVSLHNLAAQFLADDPDAPTNLLSQYMGPLLQTVLQTTEREGWDEANLRVSAYETVNILIQCSAQDCRAILGQMLPVIIQRLAATFGMQVLTNDDREAKEGLQGLLCGVIQVTTQKLGNEVTPHADSIMQNILQVLQSKSASSHEEAFLAAGALADVLGSSFEKYVPHLHQPILAGLRNHEAYHVCAIAVATVGDLARALEVKLQPYCNDYVTALLENLQNPMLNRSVKPPVLSCFGDIALAIGGHFEPYLQITLMMCMQAQATQAPEDDEDLIDYVNTLREGILEAYTGITQGLKDGGKGHLLAPYAESIFGFLEMIQSDPNNDEAILKAAIGCLGDVASTLGSRVKDYLQKPFVTALVETGMSDGDANIVDTAHWARGVIYQAIQQQ